MLLGEMALGCVARRLVVRFDHMPDSVRCDASGLSVSSLNILTAERVGNFASEPVDGRRLATWLSLDPGRDHRGEHPRAPPLA
jgi:hypothetical protein